MEEVPQDQQLEEMAVALAVGICLLEEATWHWTTMIPIWENYWKHN